MNSNALHSDAAPAPAPGAAGHPRRHAWLRWALVATLLAALISLPAWADHSTQRLCVEIFTMLAIAMAWNLLAGYGGMVVVGLHAFVGVGAYALFLASNQLELNPWAALPLAAVASVVFALVSAVPMFRLSGAHFAVGTWVLAELLRIGVLNTQLLGAGAGMPLEMISAFSRDQRNAGVYWAALAVAVGALWAARSLLRSRLGLALTSVRDSEAAAQACGVSVVRAKLALWVIAACIAGVAGAVAYMNTLQVSPDASFGLTWTAAAIFIAVLGGIGTLEGPLIGVAVYFILREQAAQWGAWYFIGLGVLAIATMLLAPGGAWSWVARKWPRFDPFGIRRAMPGPDPLTP